MIHLEQLAADTARIAETQDKMMEKLGKIHDETLKTNGRVTALEKETSRLWGFVKWGFIIGGAVVLILVAKGIVSPSDIPHP
jgi:hypothetical protein